MKTKINKRIIAREILVFVSSLVLILLLCCIPWIQNAYCHQHISALTDKKNELEIQLQKNQKIVNDPDLIAKLNAVAGVSEAATNKTETNKTPNLQTQLNNTEISIGNYEHRMYSSADLFDYIFICAVAIIGIAYVIRPLIFGVAWSINILRNESKSLDNPEPMT